MIYSVKLDQAVNFAPESVVEEVLQNVRTILLTRVGTVCLHRDFGVSWEHLDKPYPVARALMQAMVTEAIQSYEPRAQVESVTFADGFEDVMEGLMRPQVMISIDEGRLADE